MNPSEQLKRFIDKKKEAGEDPTWEIVEQGFSEGYSYGYADGGSRGITDGLKRASDYLDRIAKGKI